MSIEDAKEEHKDGDRERLNRYPQSRSAHIVPAFFEYRGKL